MGAIILGLLAVAKFFPREANSAQSAAMEAINAISKRSDAGSSGAKDASVKAATAKDSAAAKAAGPAAPVHVVVAEKRNFPIYLSGLGAVQAFNSVTIRSRVDGQIEKIAFEEGKFVKAGDLLVKIDPAPFEGALNQVIAKLAQDQASLLNAKQDYERTKDLSAKGFATKQLLDQRVAAVAQFTAQIQADTAAIATAKTQLAYTTIAAPISGTIGFRLVDAGNIVHASDQNGMLTINQLQPISVVFTAPEKDLPAIRTAIGSGPIQVQAYTSNGKTLLGEGQLKLLDNQIDQASGTIKLKATFPNSDDKLWPGLSVVTRLNVGTLKDVVVVPDTAVQRGPNGLYAYVVGSDDHALFRPLKVGAITDAASVIEDGIAAGERVVVSGHYRVQPGGSVKVLNEAAQAPAAVSPKSSRVQVE